MTETRSMHITPVGGNVFADLGFAPEDAANMQIHSQRIISEKRESMGCLIAEPNERIEEKQPEYVGTALGNAAGNAFRNRPDRI